MKLLVTGASGLLGRALMRLAASREDLDTLGTAFSRAAAPLARLDLNDESALEALLDAFKPDAVVHAAAERRPDVVDARPAEAEALNVGATARIARGAARRGARLLYLSTDYVFDGAAPPYIPHSAVNPLNAYGRMKLQGEVAAAMAFAERGAARNLDILRIPLLYGPVERLDESPVTEIAAKIAPGLPCQVEAWATRYPAHVDDVARGILAILDAGPGKADAPSIRQISGSVGYTKFDMAVIMARGMGLDPAFIQADARPPAGAPRPKDCRMDTSALAALGWLPLVGFPEGIAEVLSPWFGRKGSASGK